MRTKALSFLGLLLAMPAAMAQQSTLGDGDSYAWAGNIGWIELIPNRPAAGDGVRVFDTYLSGYGWSDSTGWINFGDGSPGGGHYYGNTDGSDAGVNLDALGDLSGLAWSANLGWINFGWAAADDPNRPRIDLQNGGFTGYAWSASAGWITLGTGILKTDSILVNDSDEDGISDAWEMENTQVDANGNETTPSLEPLTNGNDADGDGASDVAEYLADSDPMSAGDYLDIIQLIPGNTASQLTWTSRPTRHYRLKLSQTLTSWSDSAFGLIIPDAGASTARTPTHTNQPRWFFKVEPILPLSGN